MRADMFKVIVERPRWGASHAPPVKLKKDRDQDRKFVGLKRHVRECADYSKSLNENLAPLIRYLRKQRGRPWDEVFSEICAGLDTASTVKMHVRMHLHDFVLIGISTGRDGELLHRGRVLRPEQGNYRWYEFYVDPVDGILKDRVAFWQARGQQTPLRRFSWVRSQPPTTSPDLSWIDDTRLLFKQNGLWFICNLDHRPRLDDVTLLAVLLDRTWPTQGDWTVLSRRQLSKQELKRRSLQNEWRAWV
jgi:hypothetical protein